MKSLRHYILEADRKKVAIGHFNISNLEALHAIFNAAKSLNLPVIIGVSEGERKFIGLPQAVALIKSFRDTYSYPIFLNADHTYSVDNIKLAVDAGFDAVIIDAAKHSITKNIDLTKQAVTYAKSKNPSIIVEGELGYIGSSSKLLDEIPQGAVITSEHMTTPEEARDYVSKTGIDLLAPAVGNLHGMLKKAKNPSLDIQRIAQIRQAAKVALVLHGGSGVSNPDFKRAIKAGISIVHINSEIRLAFRTATQESLKQTPGVIAPYKFMRASVDAVQKVVSSRLKLFSHK